MDNSEPAEGQLLTRLRVAGFKSIKEMDLEIRPLNILVGENGAGKSNLLSVFDVLRWQGEDDLDFYLAKQGGFDVLAYYGFKRTQQITLEVDLSNTRYALVLNGAGNGRALIGEGLANAEWDTMSPREQMSASEEKHRQIHRLTSLWRKYHFQDTTTEAHLKQASLVTDTIGLHTDAKNLGAYLYRLHEQERRSYEHILGTIRMAAPFFKDFVFELNNPNYVSWRWKQEGDERVLPPDLLSDGTLRFICLTVLLESRELPSVVVLDEPELGLHPQAVHLLAEMLHAVSKHSRVIVATQSVSFLNHFDIEDVVVVNRREQASTFVRPDAEYFRRWLDDYSLGELLEKHVLTELSEVREPKSA